MLLLFSVYWKALHLLLLYSSSSSLLHSRILSECPSPRCCPGRSPRAVWFCPRGPRRPLPDTDPRALCFGKTGMSAWQRCCWLPLFPLRHKNRLGNIRHRNARWRAKLTRWTIFQLESITSCGAAFISVFKSYPGFSTSSSRSEKSHSDMDQNNQPMKVWIPEKS